RTEPIPSRMMRVELPGPYRQGTTALPVAGISDQEAQIRRSESVHWVEGDRALRGDPESLDLPPKVLRRGQRVVGEVICRRDFDGAPRGGERASQGVRLHVEPVRVFLSH